MLWLTILLSYHYRCNVVFTNYRFPVSFLLYIATQKNLSKSLLWTVLWILLSPKNNSSTLCVPMFLNRNNFWSLTVRFKWYKNYRLNFYLLSSLVRTSSLFYLKWTLHNHTKYCCSACNKLLVKVVWKQKKYFLIYLNLEMPLKSPLQKKMEIPGGGGGSTNDPLEGKFQGDGG